MKLVITLCIFSIISTCVLGNVPAKHPLKKNVGPPVICGPDTLLIHRDCQVCACRKGNAKAECYPKSCTQRSKPGSCPMATLNMDNFELCQPTKVNDPNFHPCKLDTDCLGAQICCYDFCKRTHCVNPLPPLDVKLH